jgi:hypothetical protein
VIKGTWREETVGSVTMVIDVVEAERVDESDSAARFLGLAGGASLKLSVRSLKWVGVRKDRREFCSSVKC